MTWFNHLQQALINFTAAKLRSFLALLGILVGTAAVVALLSSGQLATDKALAEFKTLGTDLLAINVYQGKQNPAARTTASMSIAQWTALPRAVSAIQKIAPYATLYESIRYQGHDIQGAIIGADESLADIIHIQLAQGYFVSFVDSFEHYCVIGDMIAEQIRMQTADDPLGQQIQLGHNLYTIIGILKHWKENSFFNEDINRAVITPIAGIHLLGQDNPINNAISSLQPNASIDEVISQLKSAVTQAVPNQMIFIRSAKQMIVSMQNQARIFTLLLTVIGGISLLVGGIGVMNVMLVSVSERKKEIGIRKAVGAKSRDIQRLFLVESVLLSLVGGVIGICVGELVTMGMAYFIEWPFTFYILPPMAGFTVSVAVGVFFGYYPAKRAALLDPIVSLREV